MCHCFRDETVTGHILYSPTCALYSIRFRCGFGGGGRSLSPLVAGVPFVAVPLSQWSDRFDLQLRFDAIRACSPLVLLLPTASRRASFSCAHQSLDARSSFVSALSLVAISWCVVSCAPLVLGVPPVALCATGCGHIFLNWTLALGIVHKLRQ